FSELAVEVIAILGFQAAYGYVYHQIGLIVASYMIGLAIGGGCSVRSLKRFRNPFRTLVGIQFLILILPLTLILFLSSLPKCGEIALLRLLGRLGFHAESNGAMGTDAGLSAPAVLRLSSLSSQNFQAHYGDTMFVPYPTFHKKTVDIVS
ncbi:MAG: hypothetical protein B1H02_06635, partial [Candidatus Latescibacteria bacterium 4484_107]